MKHIIARVLLLSSVVVYLQAKEISQGLKDIISELHQTAEKDSPVDRSQIAFNQYKRNKTVLDENENREYKAWLMQVIVFFCQMEEYIESQNSVQAGIDAVLQDMMTLRNDKTLSEQKAGKDIALMFNNLLELVTLMKSLGIDKKEHYTYFKLLFLGAYPYILTNGELSANARAADELLKDQAAIQEITTMLSALSGDSPAKAAWDSFNKDNIYQLTDVGQNLNIAKNRLEGLFKQLKRTQDVAQQSQSVLALASLVDSASTLRDFRNAALKGGLMLKDPAIKLNNEEQDMVVELVGKAIDSLTEQVIAGAIQNDTEANLMRSELQQLLQLIPDTYKTVTEKIQELDKLVEMHGGAVVIVAPSDEKLQDSLNFLNAVKIIAEKKQSLPFFKGVGYVDTAISVLNNDKALVNDQNGVRNDLVNVILPVFDSAIEGNRLSNAELERLSEKLLEWLNNIAGNVNDRVRKSMEQLSTKVAAKLSEKTSQQSATRDLPTLIAMFAELRGQFNSLQAQVRLLRR